ncbi:MAG: GntR family transcriptional regulator [Yaniella sp.]|nr:GntR family transcriptional regulator [Yaniella sp.]
MVMSSEPPSAGSRIQTQRPLWAAVRDDLEIRIRAGEFSSGIFPGELELAKEYGVSRATIRAALDPLRRSGTISAQPGQASRVVHVAEEHAYGPVYSLFAAVRSAHMSQRSAIRSAEMSTSPQAAGHLDLEPMTELVHIVRTRYADEEPLAEDEVWLAPEARGVLDMDLSNTALYESLQRRCGLTLTSGNETLHSINLNAEQSRALCCDPGAAAFYIERIGRIGDRAIEWRQTVIRGDRFSVSTTYP